MLILMKNVWMCGCLCDVGAQNNDISCMGSFYQFSCFSSSFFFHLLVCIFVLIYRFVASDCLLDLSSFCIFFLLLNGAHLSVVK